MKRFNVYVQHENFEHKGKVHANIIKLEPVDAVDEFAALKQAKEAYAGCGALLMVEPA